MFKKIQKAFAMSIILVMLFAVTCYAENAEVAAPSTAPDTALTSEAPEDAKDTTEPVSVVSAPENTETIGATEETGETGETNSQSSTTNQEEMLQNDLFLFDTTVDYKRIVDGNAYIMGNDITFNSVVGGDVFIAGNTVTIGSDALIYGNLYVLANTLTIDGYVYGGDLYGACSEIIINEKGAVNRDIRVTANKLTLNGGIGRNAYIAAGEISLGEGAKIYGNLNYSSKEAIQIPDGVVKGSIDYSEKNIDAENNTNPVLSYLMSFVYSLVVTVALLGIIILIAPKFLNKLENVEINKILPTLGLGLAGLVLPVIASIVLIITYIGGPIGFLVLAVWALLVFMLSIPIATIGIAGIIANKVEPLKKAHNIFAVIITALVIWAVGLIPYVGGIVTCLVSIYGLGLIVRNILNNRKSE